MPYMIYPAKLVIRDLDAIAQVMAMIRIRKPSDAPLTINEIYIIDESPKSILVILEVGIDKPQFIHLWQKDIRSLIDAFNPRVHSSEHKIRLDQHCRIDEFSHDKYFTRY